jgi:uncharacterized protein (TIGR02646 family)
MRPVERGDAPQVFNDYREAAPYLKERLGRYCSYCERFIAAGLAVEHVSPKSQDAFMLLEWSNFLLACIDCNSTKGNKTVHKGRCLWPDTDNTFTALTYRDDGAVKPSVKLSNEGQARAKALLDLVGLDKEPKDDKSHRWDDRREAWHKASIAKKLIANTATSKAVAAKAKVMAISTVQGHGHWSIWMTVFSDDVDMQARLIEAFPGTAQARLAMTVN